jgi:hypothetical protein
MAGQMCGHEGCACQADESGYCSEYCAKHGSHEGHVAHACDCGHPGCNAPTKAESKRCLADFAPEGRFTDA